MREKFEYSVMNRIMEMGLDEYNYIILVED